jgi:hypothetical protein
MKDEARERDNVVDAFFPSRVLGLGGSTSRIIRRISSRPEPPRASLSNGVVPVKSS